MKKRQYEGKVIDFSSNSEFLQKRRQDFNKTIKQKKKVTAGVNRSKRISMPKRSWSPENSPPPKKLKISKNMKNIGNNVYCRKIIYDSALGASHKSTHLARRPLGTTYVNRENNKPSIP
ncbi:unnamed protein product [Arctia plantaginis]|uniref:Uncharacterized protein n=1 Tax=Arctia plantaginis TaxID=874455 RepID=A0A8S0ZMW8_ARCPL|nr:unnamed protein product [Arctia plantaginis]